MVNLVSAAESLLIMFSSLHQTNYIIESWPHPEPMLHLNVHICTGIFQNVLGVQAL